MTILSYSCGTKTRGNPRAAEHVSKGAGMRRVAAVLIGVLLLWCGAADAREQSAAIFDFELTDTSRENQLVPHDAEHQARLAFVTERLRTKLAGSGRFAVIDIAPVAKEARASNLQACGGCDATLAQQLGAELAVTGMRSILEPN